MHWYQLIFRVSVIGVVIGKEKVASCQFFFFFVIVVPVAVLIWMRRTSPKSPVQGFQHSQTLTHDIVLYSKFRRLYLKSNYCVHWLILHTHIVALLHSSHTDECEWGRKGRQKLCPSHTHWREAAETEHWLLLTGSSHSSLHSTCVAALVLG